MKDKYVSPNALILKLGNEDVMNSSNVLTFYSEGEGDAYFFNDYFNKLNL